MKFLKGDYTVLSIQTDGGVFQPIGCLTSDSFNEDVELLGTTVRTNEGGWTTAIPTLQSYSISFDGIVPFENTPGVINYFDLTTIKRRRILLNWKLAFENGEIFMGKAYITNLSETSSVNEFVQFNGTLQGYGKVNSQLDIIFDEYQDRVTSQGGELNVNCTLTFISKLNKDL